MQGFKKIYGEDAKERFGEMVPVAEERFLIVEDGDSIPLGHRELQVIHTPGHDPNHLAFLDTKSKGVFCGDALGAYFSEIKALFTCPVPGSDPFLFLQSIEKLKKLKPELETMFMVTNPKFAYLSSSAVKEVARFKGCIEGLVPGEIEKDISESFKEE